MRSTRRSAVRGSTETSAKTAPKDAFACFLFPKVRPAVALLGKVPSGVAGHQGCDAFAQIAGTSDRAVDNRHLVGGEAIKWRLSVTGGHRAKPCAQRQRCLVDRRSVAEGAGRPDAPCAIGEVRFGRGQGDPVTRHTERLGGKRGQGAV